MFIDILVRFAGGAIAGLFAAVLLIWIVRLIFCHCWVAWGLTDTDDRLPSTITASAQRLDVQLALMTVACGAVMAALSASHGSEAYSVLLPETIFSALLLIQARIDAQTGLLPDRLTLSMLWLGVLFGLYGGWVPLEQSVLGAVTGYIVVWLLTAIFRWVTGREAMGGGDVKLSAAMGAWLGGWSLPNVWLIASIWVGLTAVMDHWIGRRHVRAPRPFGPGLAVGGILVMLWQVN